MKAQAFAKGKIQQQQLAPPLELKHKKKVEIDLSNPCGKNTAIFHIY